MLEKLKHIRELLSNEIKNPITYKNFGIDEEALKRAIESQKFDNIFL